LEENPKVDMMIDIGIITFLMDLLVYIGIYAILSISLNIEYGYAGIPNFGKVLSFLGGAIVAGTVGSRLALILIDPNKDIISQNYEAVAIINNTFKNNIIFALSILLVTIAISIVIGIVLGFVASYPAIRLREDYLGMTLLAMAEVLKLIAYYYPNLVGGTLGMGLPDPLIAFGGGLFRSVSYALLIAVIMILVYLYSRIILNSPLSRTLKAIRENENVAEAYGINIANARIKTLVIASAIASIAGVLYAFYTGDVHASTYDRYSWTFFVWLIVLLGGSGNALGPLVGTTVFITIRKIMDYAKGQGLLTIIPGIDPTWIQYIVLGLIFMSVLLFRPEGILKEKPSKTLPIAEIKNIQARLTKENK
jgi:branched-chain amino acid transport system permease protein